MVALLHSSLFSSAAKAAGAKVAKSAKARNVVKVRFMGILLLVFFLRIQSRYAPTLFTESRQQPRSATASHNSVRSAAPTPPCQGRHPPGPALVLALTWYIARIGGETCKASKKKSLSGYPDRESCCVSVRASFGEAVMATILVPYRQVRRRRAPVWCRVFPAGHLR